MRSLAKNIIIHQSIRTSSQKAKAVRPLVEKLISLAKENTLTARRQAQKVLGGHALVSKLFNELGPLFAKRESGFTRIITLGRRRGDNSQIVIFELTEMKKKEKKKHKKEEQAKPPVSAQEPVEQGEANQEAALKEKKVSPKTVIEERKPKKKFLGGFKNIFKKERDSL